MAAPESAPPPHLSGPAAALQQLDTGGERKGGGGGGGGGGGDSLEPASQAATFSMPFSQPSAFLPFFKSPSSTVGPF